MVEGWGGEGVVSKSCDGCVDLACGIRRDGAGNERPDCYETPGLRLPRQPFQPPAGQSREPSRGLPSTPALGRRGAGCSDEDDGWLKWWDEPVSEALCPCGEPLFGQDWWDGWNDSDHHTVECDGCGRTWSVET